MKYSLYAIICNTGDGANCLEWHKTMNEEKAHKLEESDLEYYGSGDGIQIKEFSFRTEEAMNDFMADNIHYWAEE